MVTWGELQVARWRRYGKDRLYVTAADDRRIGWVDLLTGAQQLEDAASAEALRAAVVSFCEANGLPLPPTLDGEPEPYIRLRPNELQHDLQRSRESVPIDPQGPGRSGPVEVGASSFKPDTAITKEPARAWVDLARNVPGQAARAQADAELATMRERSRVVTFLARTFDVKTDERAWRVGASGEETVGARLEKLRRHGWYVLHAVPVGQHGSDIDHVVIGPGGLWTLNTKTHPGKSVWVGKHQVRVDGHKTCYLRNSRFEADRAGRLLTDACGFPVTVSAALVFLTGTLIPDVTIKQAPEDVAVLDRTDIPAAFRRAKGRLTDDQVTSIFEQARRSTTWL